MDLSGKKVVITGGNGALGSTVARRVQELGGTAVLLDVAFSGAMADEGFECRTVDLTNREATAECFGDIGRFDAVFNIAGGFSMGPTTWELSDEEFDRLFGINVRTLLNVVRAAVPALLERGRGSIVNVGAAGALKGAANLSAYCASKSTVMRLTESLSAEVKAKGINVNAVLPSVIDTPANREAMAAADFSEWVAPGDLANVICFLGSDAARAVHGALVPVTGLL